MPVSAAAKKKIVASPRAKHRVVSEHYRSRIRSGDMQEGERLPAFAELQKEFGVTANTINRALIDLEQDGLVRREQGRGIFVAAKKTRTATGVIGCVGFDFSKVSLSPYWIQVISGVRAAIESAGMRCALYESGDGMDIDTVDGILLFGKKGAALVASLPADYPRVAVLEPHENAPLVGCDDFQIGALAAAHLVGLGHRRIGVVCHAGGPINERRLAGCRDAIARGHGVLADEDICEVRMMGKSIAAGAHQTTLDWIGKLGGMPYTGIICGNDEMAIGVIQALKASGLDVPGDVSVIGCDSTELCSHVEPKLTSINVPLVEIGELAADILLRQIRDRRIANASSLVAPTLDVRESTAAPSAPNNS